MMKEMSDLLTSKVVNGIEVTMTRHTVQDYLDKKATHEAQLVALAGKYGIQLIRAEWLRWSHGNRHKENETCGLVAIGRGRPNGIR